MVKAEKITMYKTKCPNCKRTIKTSKEQDVQCGGCGERFDLE